MTAAEFLAWRERHGLTQKAAADRLGLTARSIQFYESGKRPVSATVALLCLAYDRGFKGR